MANALSPTPPSEYAKPANKPARKKRDDEDEICKAALERYNRWYERERDNVTKAYEDLEFCWDDQQWDATSATERKNEDRPCLTVNRLPQFVHQVTGDMRQMKPGIKVVPVDSAGDKKTAEAMGGMIRYIENRSLASRIYTSGADSQVSCGIGAWRVTKEYAGKNTFNQEIRIVGVDDAVAIAVDPDAILPTREDAKWMIVPVDMSREAFKDKYPDFSVEEFDTTIPHSRDWFDKDFVRVAEYWVKKPMKRLLALMPDGAIMDLTGKDEAEIAQVKLAAKRVEQRDSFKVCRYLITAAHVLEEADWPGMYIPIVFAVGEEIRIGRKVVRRGLVRSAKDPQRMFNYGCSAQAEVTALQPKAPFVGTEKNFEKYQTEWATANRKAFPYLPYTPDPANAGARPERVQPPVGSQGISEMITLAAENIKAVIGIHDPSLGKSSSEARSGKAILALQREGDTGSYVYVDNWTMAIGHTGTIVSDLVPHVYDTERQIRIMGEDGIVDLKWINKPVGMNETDPVTGEMKQQGTVENDVTKGAYDVVLDSGPSYATKRQEARDSMTEFIRAAPMVAPAIMHLIAKMQDWPLSDEITKVTEAIAPAPVQKLIASQKKERGEDDQPPQEPDPQQQMAMQAAQLELQNKALVNEKLKVEIQTMAQGEGPDHAGMAKAQGEALRIQMDAERHHHEMQARQAEIAAREREAAIKERIAEVQLESALVDLAIKKAGLQIDTANAVLDLQGQQQGLVHEAEQHAASLVQGFEKHTSNLAQGAEAHAAKVKQMSNRPQAGAN